MFDPSSLHTRSMTYLKFAVARPWPLRDGPTGPIRPIRYCYANKEAQEELSCLLMAGFDVWARALGFPHSHTVGHNLCWKSIVLRTTSGTPPFYSPFCYLDDYKNHEDPGTWNPVVADDALVVHLTEGTPAATVGWQPGEKEGRHKLLLPKTIGVTRVAHEIGHVLGLLHEHARFDRDDFITYQCTNLKGYSQAVNAATDAGFELAYAILRLCSEKDFALQFDFIGAEYTKNDAYSNFDTGIFDEGDFDLGSIMMYPSSANTEDERCWTESRKDLCVLMAGTELKMWPIMPAQAPSRGDVEFVKKYYPYIGLPASSSMTVSDQPTTSAAVVQVAEQKVKRGPQSAVRVHRIFS
ncbi:Astacin domain containing protein [Pyrenophora tritici-repentis]|uniref:Metalloendopeptidase n=1 Tax=Pyrenophora tritici-repentis TaxID=45151 RepID=A0A834VL15_9PLEO|nr:Astacin domain containing protein [Pyrenophora tritici-repentis]KAG9377053.1 Astacin domain containing protein [Pyrenophora tritici-repentis]